MTTREQILELTEIMNMSQCYPDREHFARAIEKAAIQQYKDSLLKDVGDPVAFALSPHGEPISKGSCALEFSMADVELELRDWGYGGGRVDKLYTSDQVAEAVLKATKQQEYEITCLIVERDELLDELEKAASYHASHECHSEAKRVRAFIASVKGEQK